MKKEAQVHQKKVISNSQTETNKLCKKTEIKNKPSRQYNRRGKGRKKGSKNYFTIDTQNAIVLYNQEERPLLKNKIYDERILFSFDKLVENTINNNKFPYIKESYEDIKHEVIIHLLENMHKYDAAQGRAFAYFGVIAKNYLIAWNKLEYKNSKLYDDLDVVDYSRNISIEMNRHERQETAHHMADFMIDYLENNMYVLFKKQKDLIVIDAVIELLRKRLFIENFNKKLIFILLREMTGLKSHHITKILNKLKVVYQKLIKEYYRKGYIDTTKQNKFI